MRLHHLPLCLLGLLLPLQSIRATPTPASPTTTVTLVEVLSADPDYELLLRLIQRAKLVPTLNTLNGSTLLAPTNDAIRRYQNETLLHALEGDLTDNVQQALRQHLFYHLLNYTLNNIPEAVTIQKTLHFPAIVTDPPTKEPPSREPWLPVPGGLLGKEPQRLRTAVRDGKTFFGVDAWGGGGSPKADKDVQNAANGIVYGLDRVLDLPRSLLEEVRRHPRLKVMGRLLSDEMEELLKRTPHMTLFMPEDEAWDSLDPIERRYLESGLAHGDMEKIVQLHASVDGPTAGSAKSTVGWSQTWKKNGTTRFPTLRNHSIHISTATSPPQVGANATLIDQDIYAANGVLHTVSSLLIDPSVFQLNAEKYLLALNATQFVGLLRLANLSSYVGDDAAPWTILAPQDSVVDGWRAGGWGNDSDGDLEKVLKYHFIPGKLTPKKLKDRQLLETELIEAGLKGARQVVEVSVQKKLNGDAEPGSGDIGFGGSLVLGDPVEIGSSIIYVLSSPLTPPTDVISSLLSSLSYTTFLTSIYSTELADTITKQPLTTVLVPHNDAWKTLGLVADHLLLVKDALRRVVLHHVLKGVIYPGDDVLHSSVEGGSGAQTFATLEGSDVRLEDGQVMASGGWPTTSSSPIVIQHRKHATLTRTGTTYAVTGGLLIPRSVRITVEDLAMAGKGSIMLNLVRKAGLEGALNGTLEFDWDDHEWDDGILDWIEFGGRRKRGTKGEKVGWTLLCPTDEGFKGVNITALTADQDALEKFVRQHLVPVSVDDFASAGSTSSGPWGLAWFNRAPKWDPFNIDPSMPLPVMDDAKYSTLLSPNAMHGDVVFRALGGDKERFLVGIKGIRSGLGADTDFARVLKWGRTTIGGRESRRPPSNGSLPLPQIPAQATLLSSDVLSPPPLRSGVILIDRPLMPYQETWWITWGQAITFGMIAAAVMELGFVVVLRWFRMKESEATYEPIGRGAGGEDEG